MAKQPACWQVSLRVCGEVVGMLILVLPMAYIYVFTSHFEPYHRGFFCDDQSLKHPYLPQTVPIVHAFIIWATLSVVLIVLVEALIDQAEKSNNTRRKKPIDGNWTPWIVVELYRHLGFFALGALSCLLFTELAKYTVGRLRPHYLTICDPDLTDELCLGEHEYKKWVEINEATQCRGLIENGGSYNKKQLHEARLSFMSGHSSFSFYCATFLIVYLQARLTNFPKSKINYIKVGYRTLKILRPFIQFGMIILAFWICLTRISDYFHHPLDILTGSIVGMIFASVTLALLITADIFNKKSAFSKTLSCMQDAEIGTAAMADLDELKYIDEEFSPRDKKDERGNTNMTNNSNNAASEQVVKGETSGRYNLRSAK